MDHRVPVAAFVVALAVYGVAAGTRLNAPSSDRHFIAQAEAWIHGRLDIQPWPDGADDRAVVEHVLLDDGTAVKGRRLLLHDVFRVAGGDDIPMTRIRESRGSEFHVAFPPFPAAVFVPLVFVFGPTVSDVLVTVVAAALVPSLFLLVLRRLRARGLMRRDPRDDLWLAVLLACGTVLFFSAVQGRVWYTAHVFAVVLCLGYVWASIDGAQPLLAGACLGLAFLTRAPMLFMSPLFVGELWRTGRLHDWRRWLMFAAPVAAAGALAAWHNAMRFDDVMEFGHSYLRVRQQTDIERYGLFNTHYLLRNATAAFTLLPEIGSTPPYVTVSGHGLAMWFTSPALVLLARAWPRTPFQRSLWMTAMSVGLWTLLYQNTGWFQFGFRFSLDYIVFLLVILAVDTRPLTRVAKGLIVVAVVINGFGAATFNRHPQFYRADRAAYGALVHD